MQLTVYNLNAINTKLISFIILHFSKPAVGKWIYHINGVIKKWYLAYTSTVAYDCKQDKN